jgi:hypothetical protein
VDAVSLIGVSSRALVGIRPILRVSPDPLSASGECRRYRNGMHRDRMSTGAREAHAGIAAGFAQERAGGVWPRGQA